MNRDSKAYKAGKLVGRVILITVGFFLGKRWGRRPIDKFPRR